MKVGTKSVLFGAHQFLIHPVVLAISWWKLYGFPWDPRLWVAFVVHDLGYIFKPDMDGPEGETHVEFGAHVMHWLFDWPRMKWTYEVLHGEDASRIKNVKSGLVPNTRWRDFCLYHSRFYAKKHDAHVSQLCLADKMAIVVMPTWLWVFLCTLTGELQEYLIKAQTNREQESKYVSMNIYHPEPHQFYENVKTYIRAWVEAHKRGEADHWTPGGSNEVER